MINCFESGKLYSYCCEKGLRPKLWKKSHENPRRWKILTEQFQLGLNYFIALENLSAPQLNGLADIRILYKDKICIMTCFPNHVLYMEEL